MMKLNHVIVLVVVTTTLLPSVTMARGRPTASAMKVDPVLRRLTAAELGAQTRLADDESTAPRDPQALSRDKWAVARSKSDLSTYVASHQRLRGNYVTVMVGTVRKHVSMQMPTEAFNQVNAEATAEEQSQQMRALKAERHN